MESGKTIKDELMFLPERSRWLSVTIAYDFDTKLTIGIFQDVTKQEEDRIRKEERDRKTIETADALVEKQMRIVQEIASLLGETTAETKIALTRLKETAQHE